MIASFAESAAYIKRELHFNAVTVRIPFVFLVRQAPDSLGLYILDSITLVSCMHGRCLTGPRDTVYTVSYRIIPYYTRVWSTFECGLIGGFLRY